VTPNERLSLTQNRLCQSPRITRARRDRFQAVKPVKQFIGKMHSIRRCTYVHRIERFPIISLYKICGFLWLSKLNDSNRTIGHAVTERNTTGRSPYGPRNIIMKNTDRTKRRWAIPSAAGATNARKSEGVIHAGTARTPRVIPSSEVSLSACPEGLEADLSLSGR
jgi:hypothetical protein